MGGVQNHGSIQVSGDVPIFPSLRPKVWVGACLGLGLGLWEGRGREAHPQKPGLIQNLLGGQSPLGGGDRIHSGDTVHWGGGRGDTVHWGNKFQ